MKPALTAKEWEDVDPTADDVWENAWGESVGRHAAAARALHGQEFGFTWEDVDDERAELAGLEGQLRGWQERSALQQLADNERTAMDRLAGRVARKRSRVARIAALLPPRVGTKTGTP